ncbi:MAG: ORF6C domain-containing protein [Anaerolineales bacterium]|nr:ORF6C domain-containing protein [Anaerolineales bacterium]MCA9998878.1 ORF6C domain-containing protein [Anaerolineales bacterium]
MTIALGKQTKRNEFGAVYGEMYRKFGICSYKLLPAHQFQKVMHWLAEWYQSITDEALPF